MGLELAACSLDLLLRLRASGLPSLSLHKTAHLPSAASPDSLPSLPLANHPHNRPNTPRHAYLQRSSRRISQASQLMGRLLLLALGLHPASILPNPCIMRVNLFISLCRQASRWRRTSSAPPSLLSPRRSPSGVWNTRWRCPTCALLLVLFVSIIGDWSADTVAAALEPNACLPPPLQHPPAGC